MPVIVTHERTMSLRYVKRGTNGTRVLQQQWKITYRTDTGAETTFRHETEWRDIPLEEETDRHTGDAP